MTSEIDLLRAYAAKPEEEEFYRGLLLDYYLENDPERAEFLKLHSQLKGMNCPLHLCTKPLFGADKRFNWAGTCTECTKDSWCVFHSVEQDIELILQKNRDRWLRVRCPECIAGRVVDVSTGTRSGCKTCMSTGDLCRFTHPGTASQDQFDVERKNGFPYKVTGAKHADVFRQMTKLTETKCKDCNGYGRVRNDWFAGDEGSRKCVRCEGMGRFAGFSSFYWEPTEVAVAWLTHHPTVREIEVSDVRPLNVSWMPDMPQVFRNDNWEPQSHWWIVGEVYDRMETDSLDTLGTGVVARRWNRQDHSRAVADWVRSFVK